MDVHSVAGKSYRPLNEGCAPGWLRMNDSALGIVCDQRSGVALVNLEARRNGMRRIVDAALDLRARPQAAHELVFGHVEQQDVIQPLAALAERLVYELRLRRGARKTVEDRAGLRLRAVQLLLDHAEYDAVGHQLAFVVVLLELEPERRPVPHRLPDQITGGDLGQPQPLGEDLALLPLARARRSQDEDEHLQCGH